MPAPKRAVKKVPARKPAKVKRTPAARRADPLDLAIGRAILARREHLGYTRSALGNEAGISANNIYYIETGQTSPTIRTLVKLAIALDIQPATLIEQATRN